jgi:hypothetical protein
MALNVSLSLYFINRQDWKGIDEKKAELIARKLI